jgi:microcompartment protein CcmL/EutN
MAVLSIREVDNAALAAWKKAAIDECQTLRDWVIGRLNESVKKVLGSQGIVEQTSLEGRSVSVVREVQKQPTEEENKERILEGQRRLEERKKQVKPIAPSMPKAAEDPWHPKPPVNQELVEAIRRANEKKEKDGV